MEDEFKNREFSPPPPEENKPPKAFVEPAIHMPPKAFVPPDEFPPLPDEFEQSSKDPQEPQDRKKGSRIRKRFMGQAFSSAAAVTVVFPMMTGFGLNGNNGKNHDEPSGYEEESNDPGHEDETIEEPETFEEPETWVEPETWEDIPAWYDPWEDETEEDLDFSFLLDDMGRAYEYMLDDDFMAIQKLFDAAAGRYREEFLNLGQDDVTLVYDGSEIRKRKFGTVEEGVLMKIEILLDLGSPLHVELVTADDLFGEYGRVRCITYNGGDGPSQLWTATGVLDSSFNGTDMQISSYEVYDDYSRIYAFEYCEGEMRAGYMTGRLTVYNVHDLDIPPGFKRITKNDAKGESYYDLNTEGCIDLSTITYGEDMWANAAAEEGYDYVLNTDESGQKYIYGLVKNYDGTYSLNGYQLKDDHTSNEVCAVGTLIHMLQR